MMQSLYKHNKKSHEIGERSVKELDQMKKWGGEF